MKKILGIFLAMMLTIIATMSISASNESTSRIRNAGPSTISIVQAENAVVVKNNVKCNFSNDKSNFEITIKYGKNPYEKISFDVFEKIENNEKLFLRGNGSYNVNLICVDGTNICIPISKHKKMVVNNPKLASYIRALAKNTPESNYGFGE